jgi:single-strand DNA-binding protein
MNKIIVIGNLGQDPTMRYTPTGQMVTSFSVASNHRYRTASGEQKEETEWFNCSAFGKLAETCNQYLTKGQQVYVEGRLSTRTYQTQGGETRQSLDVRVSDIQFLGSRSAGVSTGQRDFQPGVPAPAGDEDETIELPF